MADFGGLGGRRAQAGWFFRIFVVVSFQTSLRTSNSDSVCKSYACFTEGVSEIDSNSFWPQMETAITFDPVGQMCSIFFWGLWMYQEGLHQFLLIFTKGLMCFPNFGRVDTLFCFVLFFFSLFCFVFLLSFCFGPPNVNQYNHKSIIVSTWLNNLCPSVWVAPLEDPLRRKPPSWLRVGVHVENRREAQEGVWIRVDGFM